MSPGRNAPHACIAIAGAVNYIARFGSHTRLPRQPRVLADMSTLGRPLSQARRRGSAHAPTALPEILRR